MLNRVTNQPRCGCGWAGETVRVPTGGMLPPGADAVVIQERSRVLDETVEVHRPVRSGENMISRGEDVRAGDTVLRAGRRLRPPDLGVLAGLGHARVAVRLRPTVAIISSGGGSVAPGRPAGAGPARG